MPITLDTIAAGFQIPKPFIKNGVTMAAAGGQRAWTPRYAAGFPGATAAPTAGINGVAVANGTGNIPRTNPPGGTNAYLARLSVSPSQQGTLMVIDRLWENSGLVTTSIVAQP
ncbi:MAG: hypothetical protein ACRCYS_02710, partial [Beijerinckiaceae bacterium]